MVDEIEALVRAHGVDRIRFMDDEFAGPGERGRRRARAIAAEILERKRDGYPPRFPSRLVLAAFVV